MSRYRRRTRRRAAILFVALCALVGVVACTSGGGGLGIGGVHPRAMRDVPAARLAFRFEPDSGEIPASFDAEVEEELFPTVKADFETRRKDDALLRTVVSPSGQRVLALYATNETPEGDFRFDIYSSEGQFLRTVLPPELTGTFPQWVAWSPDDQQIAFVGIKNSTPQPTPTPFDELLPPVPGASPEASPTPAPSVAPLIAPVPVFGTEQIYVCNRDGYEIRPLTSRDGLIYFQFAWSPDSLRLAALACKSEEWDARRAGDRTAAGRPRLIDLEGRERLLSDQMADAAPVWSPDASKVATAFETTVAIYDAIGDAPTGAEIPLREPMLKASAEYDAQKLAKKASAAPPKSNDKPSAVVTGVPSATESVPLSFNPVVRLEWAQPEIIYLRTAFVRQYKSGEMVGNYSRWHTLHLSPQAIVLGGHKTFTHPSLAFAYSLEKF